MPVPAKKIVRHILVWNLKGLRSGRLRKRPNGHPERIAVESDSGRTRVVVDEVTFLMTAGHNNSSLAHKATQVALSEWELS